MRPRGEWRQREAEEGSMERTLTQEHKVGGRWGWGKQAHKKNRQNRKINEVLFQWQDLCTVNITLAIRGNPITLCLSFLYGREERRKQKDEKWKETDTEREKTPLHGSSTFQHILRNLEERAGEEKQNELKNWMKVPEGRKHNSGR